MPCTAVVAIWVELYLQTLVSITYNVLYCCCCWCFVLSIFIVYIVIVHYYEITKLSSRSLNLISFFAVFHSLTVDLTDG